MKIALFPNMAKKQSEDVAKEIAQFLIKRGVEVFAEDANADLIGTKPYSSVAPTAIDFLITLGGDGTILRTIHRHLELTAPLLAINLGSLGFMADIKMEEIYPSLEKLLHGDYKIDSRMMLEGHYKQDKKGYAVNEIVIHREKNPCLIDLSIRVDGRYLNTFSADGVIISTPCGSTAYSLAAGGPILTPELEAIVITPICPHTISNRPIVLMPDQNVQVEYISSYEPIEVTFDGFPFFHLSKGEVLQINRSKRDFKLVSLPEHDYFATLRSKLGWSGKLRASQ